MFIRGAGEMARCFRAFVDVVEDPGSIPSIDVVASKSTGESVILSRPPWTLHAHGTQAYIQAKHSYT